LAVSPFLQQALAMADDLVLYDNPGSSNALKVRFLLEELGQTVRTVEVPIGDARPDWYRAIHPFATVPTLVDGNLTIIESNTILRYLADRAGRTDLAPTEPAARARVDQLLDALSLAVRPVLWDLEMLTVKTEYLSPGDVPDATRIAAAATALGEVLDGWERLIEPNGYATGTFTIADIAATARMWDLPRLPLDPSRYPRTWQLLEVVGARPAFLRARG
jgi:glutathione S-transferase